ncbi:MAG: DEAD/DEAH box helicase [Pseudomonadota bacterium]
MTLSDRLSNYFEPAVRERGADYVRARRVGDVSRTRAGISAPVSNPQGDCYTVTLRYDAGVVVAGCECQHFIRANLCKHIWATLLSPACIAWLAAEVEQHADDVAAAPQDLVPTVLHALEWQSTNRAYVDPPPATRPDWLQRLGPLIGDAPSSANGLSRSRHRESARIPWFVVDLGASEETESLVVRFAHQPILRNGELGQPRIQSAGPLSSYVEPADRRLMELMLALANSESIGYLDAKTSCTLPSALFGTLLPDLVSSGRLVLQRERGERIAELVPLRWESEPYQLSLDGERDDTQGHWILKGAVSSALRRYSIGQCDLLLSDGLLISDNSMASLTVPPALLRWLDMLRDGPLAVPFSDRIAFNELWHRHRANALPGLPPDLLFSVVSPPVSGLLALSEEVAAGNGKSRFKVQAQALYDGTRVAFNGPGMSVVDAQRERIIQRDSAREQSLLEELTAADLARSAESDAGGQILNRNAIPGLLKALQAQGWQLEFGGQPLRFVQDLELLVSSGPNRTRVTAQIDYGDVTASLSDWLPAAADNAPVMSLDNGAVGWLSDELSTEGTSWASFGQAEGDAIEFSPGQALLLDLMLQAQSAAVRQEAGFARVKQKLASLGDTAPAEAAPDFCGKLRSYQQRGVGWLQALHKHGLHGCLADDMGLGKTVQVLAHLQHVHRDHKVSPSLVVVPKSLVFNWLDEATRFTPELRTLGYTGQGRHQLRPRLREADVVVTTYGTLRRDIEWLVEHPFTYAILDEAQAIKNPESQAAKASRLVRAKHRLVVTGTPVENHLGDLWSLFEFLNPGLLGSRDKLVELSRTARDDENAQRLISTLGRGLKPLILRRTKEEAAPELPRKTEQVLLCELGEAERGIYDALRHQFRRSISERVADVGLNRAKVNVLEALLRLRQAACHPALIDPDNAELSSAKVELLCDHLVQLAAQGEKALVFSQFTKLLALVRTRLEQSGLAYEYLDGRTRNRAQRVQKFQSDPDISAFLISLKAGGQGLNLTAAQYVFILDPWWNPAAEAQAVDRAHRIGQTQPVFAYRLLAANTVEERVMELQKSKRLIADAVVAADNRVLKGLELADLELLLS